MRSPSGYRRSRPSRSSARIAISSSAYATEEILRVLVLAGAGALLLSLPIAAAIALLLAVVSTSYRQIGYAYPSGGGAYAVARANLTPLAALVAAGALLIDYVMTVAVSTTSAIEQIISIVPELADGRLVMAVAAVTLITVGNLRGLRESGNIFAIPTYLFVGSAMLMIVIGVFRIVALGEGAPPPDPLPGAPDPLQPIGLLLILRAFASGSVALTGTEAIANGVPAFKPPEARNAATTLTAVAIILAILFMGITFVADSYGIVAIDEPVPRTVISQVAAVIFGDGSHRLLRVPGVHRAHPISRGEHELQRLPPAGRDPGPRRLHAPPVQLPRRPAGVHIRHHHLELRRDRP